MIDATTLVVGAVAVVGWIGTGAYTAGVIKTELRSLRQDVKDAIETVTNHVDKTERANADRVVEIKEIREDIHGLDMRITVLEGQCSGSA